MMTGNSGRLSTDIDGSIYYSFFYPYKIAIILDKDKQNWGIDFYDPQGNWLNYISKNDSNFPNKFSFRYWTTDSKGNIYFDIFTKTEPVVVKYSINFKKMKPV